MSTEPSPSGGAPAPAPVVAAIVVVDDAEALVACLDAVGRQVYEPGRVIVVGGDDTVRHLATERNALWRSDLRAVPDALGPDAGYLWFLRAGTRPRPDALGALVRDAERVDASIAGSKVLDADDPRHLVAVGLATDVFDAPYTGLQEDEVDQEQYDVIRDVAAVSGMSMLVRRDLYRGLGGVDRALAPTAAAIDLCQRARLRGARVVVAPASEVLYQGPDPTAEWRERAGEIRAMLKAYGPITLLWAVPLALLAGLVESIVAPFLGRWRLFGLAAAWLWNLVYLPTTIQGRLHARRGRAVGDEELFRYQVGGSARLRALYDRMLERIRERFPEGVLAGFIDVVETGQQRLRRPSFVAGLIAVVAVIVATRVIWNEHLPLVGLSLPPPASAGEALSAYAGGWNPAGLGTIEVLRPDIGATALVQLVLFGHGGLAVAVLVVGSAIAGVVGTVRVLRSWGVGSVAGFAAGIVFVAGPAAVAIGATTEWTALVGLGMVPWAIGGSLAGWPKGLGRRTVRLAGIALSFGVVGVFSPAMFVVPLAAVLLWALLGSGPRWWAVARAAGGAALAVPLLMPWVLYADLPSLYATGVPAFWEPWSITAAALGLAVLAGIAGADRLRATVAGWGGTLAVLGALAARSGDFGGGREALLAGLAAVSVGSAAVVGVAFEAAARRGEWSGLRRGAAAVAAVAGVLVVGTVIPGVADGRAGLPEDELTGVYDFAVASEGPPGRVLVFGQGPAVPGETRDYEGLGYRVFTPPVPASWEARLGEPRMGDEALVAALDEIVAGEVRRAGARLAPFGIAWIVFSEDSELAAVFESQLDLVPLRSLSFPGFHNEVVAALALGDDGIAWEPAGTGFTEPPEAASASVYLAMNADDRWGPGTWAQSDWASVVVPDGDVVGFGGYAPRRVMAVIAVSWLAVLVLVVVARRWLR